MSEVKFNSLNGNYGYYQQDDSSKAEEELAQENASVSSEAKTADPDKIMDALAYMGAQNFVNVAGKLPVNPSDYLSQDSIASIENSMADFEKGVGIYADAIKAEFGDMFSEEQVLALAANAFAGQ